MENNENKSKGISIGSIVFIIICIVGLFNIFIKPSMNVPKDAQAHVKQEVMRTIGITATKFNSDIIYNKDGNKIVVVKYGIDSSGYDGSQCLYYKNNRYYSSTKIMPVDYDYKENLEDVKAYFGIL